MTDVTYQDAWDYIMLRAPRGDGVAEKPFALFLTDHRGYLQDLKKPALDIGPGHEGRHSRAIESRGIQTVSVDVSRTVRAHLHADIRNLDAAPESFGLIVDIKTMCYIDPPMDKIHSWLCKGGFFYCMTPTDRHKKEEGGWDVSQGLPIRLYSKEEVRDMLHMFEDVNIRELYEPIGRTQWLSTWCVEARK